MTRDEDFLGEVIRQMLLVTGGQRTEAIQRLEVEIRRQWGGDRPYIQKMRSVDRMLRVCDALEAGASLGAVFDAAGVSRRTGFRMLSRRR